MFDGQQQPTVYTSNFILTLHHFTTTKFEVFHWDVG